MDKMLPTFTTRCEELLEDKREIIRIMALTITEKDAEIVVLKAHHRALDGDNIKLRGIISELRDELRHWKNR